MSYTLALTFEDGVTRFIDCNPGETVLDAAYRQRINLPMDCSDGVCGTCKCHCEKGDYALGGGYLEEALSASEAAEGQVLTCQMTVTSDCVLRVPVPAARCKTGLATYQASVAALETLGDAAVTLRLTLDRAPDFLPGQYMNLEVPGSGQTRAYSFSSLPGEAAAGFLIKQVPGGLMSGWLAQAGVGDQLHLSGPLGSFFLREVRRPLLFLAGGTGLAPFLSMLAVLAEQGCEQSIHVLYGVTRDEDLVLVDEVEAYRRRLPGLQVLTCVADPTTRHPRQGYVTEHLPGEALNGGDVDIYLCGPRPMVDAVRHYLRERRIEPANFHYEKFTPTVVTSGNAA
ncbi:MAG: benzoate 1,2-dioxygenase electron transfer component BenC [Pseudomonas oryzihabitans]